ncbi:hypothetical protein BCR35DRAFT_288643 [Leucosporidium creatinivorum]|uniref:Short-chain dehydrogenase/reductase 3 n=1 Tax=Leucosporidium creatinivorum TaxID=106004 RepID=A0A1Y2FXS6_9BASI|nr:hypothetical protein BCR35DRAFT_288643 [Leucosporidium creatinivorum]
MTSPTKVGPSVSIDDVFRLLDKGPFSIPGSLLVAGYSYYKALNIYGPSLSIFEHLSHNRLLSLFLSFVALKALNRIASRLVRNHGWKADPPRWSFNAGEGDVVLITGGSTGIGKEVVDLLARRTNKIAVLDLAPPTYDAKDVKWYKCDVTDPAAIAEVAKRVRAELGHPTVLINNAGIARGSTILDTTAEQFLLTFKVNVLGAHNILREFLPHLISINHGHVMTTASSASYIAIAQLSEYACSKAAALALHEVLNEELVHRYNAPRVRTSVICPTKVSTQMGDAMRSHDNEFVTPTLKATWLAERMVGIINSGLSDHLVAPHFAKLLLPSVRSMPEWFRWIVNTAGKTRETITDAGNAVQKKTYKIVEELDALHGMPAAAAK